MDDDGAIAVYSDVNRRFVAVAPQVKLTTIGFMRKNTYQLLAGLLFISVAQISTAKTIAKCQDAQGNWHYGDYASQECENDITEMREDGLKVRVLKAPPTMEEIEAERKMRAEKREAQLKYEQKRRVDMKLLSKYPSEQDIYDLLNKKVIELNNQIKYNRNNYNGLLNKIKEFPEPKNEREEQDLHELETLRDRFARALKQGENALVKTKSDFNLLLERYRQIGE